MNLLESLTTINDLEILIEEIESVKREIFSAENFDILEKLLKKNMTETKVSIFIGYLRGDKKNVYNSHKIEDMLELLRKKASEIEVLTVYLPIELSKTEFSKMQKKLSQLLGKQIILKIETDAELLGGVKLEYGGKLLDISLASTVRKMISTA